eukprot:gene36343-biopygen23872
MTALLNRARALLQSRKVELGLGVRVTVAAFSALALFLMVADARFQITGPVRQAIGSVLYPVQWLVFQPVELARHGSGYFQSLQSAQADADAAAQKLVLVSQQAHQAERLAQETVRLRKLLALRERLQTLREAVQSRHKLHLVYRDVAGEPSERTVRPLGCFYWGKVWTLSAWCELRNDFRGFRLDRMEAIELLSDRFRDESGKTLADMLRALNVEKVQGQILPIK